MAVNIVEAQSQAMPPVQSRLQRLISSILYRTADTPLQPRGYLQIALTEDKPVSLGALATIEGENGVPEGARIAVINVEGGPVRYSDSTRTSDTIGALFPAGTNLVVTLWDLRVISLCAPGAGVVINVHYYSYR